MLKILKKYRRILYLITIIAIITTLIAVKKTTQNTICDTINVIITDSNEAKFLTKNIITSYILQNKNFENIEGNYWKNIKINEIEKLLEKHPYIKTNQVYRKNNNTLEIKITQRKPIMRIFDKKNFSYYIDNEGYILPINNNFATYVHIFNGNIPHLDTITKTSKTLNINEKYFKNTNIKKLYEFSMKLKQNEFTNALIDQIYITEKNKIQLIPKIGKFIITFGHLKNTQTKFDNLKAFYKQITKKKGWNIYSEINLTYTNQIVCTKK